MSLVELKERTQTVLVEGKFYDFKSTIDYRIAKDDMNNFRFEIETVDGFKKFNLTKSGLDIMYEPHHNSFTYMFTDSLTFRPSERSYRKLKIYNITELVLVMIYVEARGYRNSTLSNIIHDLYFGCFNTFVFDSSFTNYLAPVTTWEMVPMVVAYRQEKVARLSSRIPIRFLPKKGYFKILNEWIEVKFKVGETHFQIARESVQHLVNFVSKGRDNYVLFHLMYDENKNPYLILFKYRKPGNIMTGTPKMVYELEIGPHHYASYMIQQYQNHLREMFERNNVTDE
jgi:hypothetical protein